MNNHKIVSFLDNVVKCECGWQFTAPSTKHAVVVTNLHYDPTKELAKKYTLEEILYTCRYKKLSVLFYPSEDNTCIGVIVQGDNGICSPLILGVDVEHCTQLAAVWLVEQNLLKRAVN